MYATRPAVTELRVLVHGNGKDNGSQYMSIARESGITIGRLAHTQGLGTCLTLSTIKENPYGLAYGAGGDWTLQCLITMIFPVCGWYTEETPTSGDHQITRPREKAKKV